LEEMASLFEQLDHAVQELLVHPEAPLRATGVRIRPLVGVASQLRDLPRADFRARLQAQLLASIQKGQGVAGEVTRRGVTSRVSPGEKAATTTVSPIPTGYRTITPYIVVNQAAELIDFVKQVFGAEEKFRGTGSAGGIHCEVQIGDSMMMIGGGGKWRGTPNPTAIHLYVEDTDAAYQRAVAAGATTLRPPQDQFYGDREASVRDPFGNHWYIATNKATGGAPEGMNTVTVYLHPREASPTMQFLSAAFGAEEVFRFEHEGVVHHARMRIGTSMIEMGAAHAEFQPMPTMFYLYVEDADALYERALQAGATPVSPPTDHPYGDRSGAVRDPFGNDWHIATHIKDIAV
jgi:PhnB protein